MTAARTREAVDRAVANATAREKVRRTPLAVARDGRRYERHARQTVAHVDLWSVLKVSLCFFLCALVVTLVTGLVLWYLASAVGVIDSVQRTIANLSGSKNFEFLSWRILKAATLIGMVMVCLLTVLTTLAAALYNLFADLIGGVEIKVIEEDPRT